jgi:hypothetical protein
MTAPSLRCPAHQIRALQHIQFTCARLSISVTCMIRLAHTINSMSPIPRTARVPHTSKLPEACPHCGSHAFTRRGTAACAPRASREQTIRSIKLFPVASCRDMSGLVAGGDDSFSWLGCGTTRVASGRGSSRLVVRSVKAITSLICPICRVTEYGATRYLSPNVVAIFWQSRWPLAQYRWSVLIVRGWPAVA